MEIHALITLLSAVFYGLACGMIAYLVMNLVLHPGIGQGQINDEIRHSLPVLLRLLVPLVPLVRPVAESSLCKPWREVVAPKLWMSGYGESVTATDFVGLKIVCFLVGVISLFLGALAGFPVGGLLMGILFAIYPGVWLNSSIRKRHLAILKALPNVLDLLTLSVEAGKDFLTSLRDILQRRRIDPLGEELLRTFQEIQLGRKRTDALRDLSKRVRQADLTSVINAIIQAEELGVSIGQLLRIQGDMLRSKRFTLAEKLANEAPVKMIPAIILFILPAVFIILIVPIGMKIADVLM